MRSGLALFQMVCSGWSARWSSPKLAQPRDRSDGGASDMRGFDAGETHDADKGSEWHVHLQT